ncbi:MAG: hypothetical protein ACTHOI_04765 [Sphingomicrobium sp.]
MSKDKKKKKKDKKKGKDNGSLASATRSLKAITENPLVADVVAAALVSMAAALKDSNKARKLAADAGDQLGDMAKDSAERGSAMWDLALDVGRRTLEALATEGASAKKKR